MKYPLIGLLLALISISAAATVKKPSTPPPEPPPMAVSESDAIATAKSGAKADAAAGAYSDATGGQAEATGGTSNASTGPVSATAGGGDSTGASSQTSYDSSFFALSRSQPGASGCWGGVDGGGASGGGGGFLGIHLLNKDCWASHIAELERSLMLRARLNCGSRTYRKAVAFEFPKRDQQRECNRIVMAEYQAQIDHDNSQGQNVPLLQDIDRLEKTLLETSTDRDSVLSTLRNCRIGNERVTDAYRDCLSK